MSAAESDVGAADFRRRYFGEAGGRIRGHDFYRVVIAQVAPRGTMGPDGDDTEL